MLCSCGLAKAFEGNLCCHCQSLRIISQAHKDVEAVQAKRQRTVDDLIQQIQTLSLACDQQVREIRQDAHEQITRVLEDFRPEDIPQAGAIPPNPVLQFVAPPPRLLPHIPVANHPAPVPVPAPQPKPEPEPKSKGNAKCPLCDEALTDGDDIIVLRCGCRYHTICYEDYKDSNSVCVECNAPL